jgi:predicted metal-dependent hydrolase
MRRSPSLEIRNLRFDLSSDIARPWHDAGRAVTLFFDNLSTFFPLGERFFIASVNAHRHLIDDDELAAQVQDFCAQEGIHSREHRRYNRLLHDEGYPVDAMEGRLSRLLERISRAAPPRRRLAATCALEHFTALMGHFVLSDPRVLGGAHPTMANLWRWHSAEENEHKAVAFDVYNVARGPYAERATTMLATTVIFWAKVLEQQARLMHTDGIAWSPAEWAALARWMFVEPGWIWRLVGAYFAYYRPGFHPWDLDNHELLEAWKRDFATWPIDLPRT